MYTLNTWKILTHTFIPDVHSYVNSVTNIIAIIKNSKIINHLYQYIIVIITNDLLNGKYNIEKPKLTFVDNFKNFLGMWYICTYN